MIKGIPVTLTDGNEYLVPPLTLGAFERLHDQIVSVEGGVSAASIPAMIDVAHGALKRNYPEMTRDQTADLIDLDNMSAVFLAALAAKAIPNVTSEGELST